MGQNERKGAMAARLARAAQRFDNLPVSVQTYACMICVSDKWRVIAASDNCATLLGLPPEQMLGQSFGTVFTGEPAHRLRSKAQVLSTYDPVARI